MSTEEEIGEQRDRRTPTRRNEHVPPTILADSFHCGFCGVLTTQLWTQLGYMGYATERWARVQDNDWSFAACARIVGKTRSGSTRRTEKALRCGRRPPASRLPHIDMPKAVADEYSEAANIVGRSPRGACALLRLGVQVLMGSDELTTAYGTRGKNLDDDIATLVKQGLNVMVQQALDSVRVIGNNAVHPLELDLRDDRETATMLFQCLNTIVEQMIEQPRRMGELYSRLPQGARDAIAKRDGTTTT